LQAWLDFGRGPLFRLAFALMLLGLLRILVLTAVAAVEALRCNPDRIVDWADTGRQTLAWLLPVNRLWRKRPVYSVISFIFHVGLLSVPPFLAAHVLLWRRSVGFAWPALPQVVADWLTLVVIATGLGLFLGRALHPAARALSRTQDYFWLLLLVVPFLTGYLCSNVTLSPTAYQTLMLLHVYAANLIMAMIPFTKIAHCALAPLSQLVTSIAWKFPAGAGDRVAATLGYAGRPSWAEQARLGGAQPQTEELKKEVPA
jgi:nitrate reductase gamma subunit